MSDKNAPVTLQPAELVPYRGSPNTKRTSAEMEQIKVDVQGICDELLRLSTAPVVDESRRQRLLADLDILKRAAAEQNWQIVVNAAQVEVGFVRPTVMHAERVAFVHDGQRHEIFIALPDGAVDLDEEERER